MEKNYKALDKPVILSKLIAMESNIKSFLPFEGRAAIARRFTESISFLKLHAVSERNMNLIYGERKREYDFCLRKAQEMQDKKEELKKQKRKG